MNLNILIKIFKNKYKLNVKLINASKLFLKNKLKNISNPEKKKNYWKFIY